MKFEKAKKIWTPSSGVNTYADFSAKFAKGDRVRVSCDGNYALYINGSFVDAGQYPGYEDLQFFDEPDISRASIAFCASGFPREFRVPYSRFPIS